MVLRGSRCDVCLFAFKGKIWKHKLLILTEGFETIKFKKKKYEKNTYSFNLSFIDYEIKHWLKVSIENTSCTDNGFNQILDIYFKVSDFEKMWDALTNPPSYLTQEQRSEYFGEAVE